MDIQRITAAHVLQNSAQQPTVHYIQLYVRCSNGFYEHSCRANVVLLHTVPFTTMSSVRIAPAACENIMLIYGTIIVLQ